MTFWNDLFSVKDTDELRIPRKRLESVTSLSGRRKTNSFSQAFDLDFGDVRFSCSSEFFHKLVWFFITFDTRQCFFTKKSYRTHSMIHLV